MADEQECELDVAAVTRITAFSDLTHDVAGVEGEVTNLDGGFKTGPQDWTTRKCGKVDLSMWVF